MNNHTSKSDIAFQEIEESAKEISSTRPNVQEIVPQDIIHIVDPVPTQPHHSGRVEKQHERHIFVIESSDLIVGDEHDIDPWINNEAMRDENAEENTLL